MDVPTTPPTPTAPATEPAPAASAPTTYHIRRGTGIIATLVLFCICLGFAPTLVSTILGLASVSSAQLGVTISASLMLACVLGAFIFGYILILRLRIITSAEGIAYYCTTYHLFTSWQNVEGIGERINSRGLHKKVLELRKPAETFEANRWLRFTLAWTIAPESFIPLDIFVTLGKEESSELLQEIETHISPETAPVSKKKSKGKK